jgi:hypothetical protein
MRATEGSTAVRPESERRTAIMKVQIVYPADGWILNKLAKYLIDNIDFATGSEWKPDTASQWDITYYVNYFLFKPHYSLTKPLGCTKNSRLTGAFFTHRENNFDKRARQVDFCVSPCRTSADFLSKINKHSYCIYHGIDLEKFSPKITLGFIGKLQSSGRKGEDLFDHVRKLPYVEIVATNGEVPEERLPGVYHAIDAVLITSTIEGGPLCFQEGLACGKEIISTDVGMVSDFKGREGIYIYERNNPEELLNIIRALYEKKLQRRTIIERYSIDYFVNEHSALFKSFCTK